MALIQCFRSIISKIINTVLKEDVTFKKISINERILFLGKYASGSDWSEFIGNVHIL